MATHTAEVVAAAIVVVSQCFLLWESRKHSNK